MSPEELLDAEYELVRSTEEALRYYRKYLFYRRHKWMSYIPFGGMRELWAYAIWSLCFTHADINMKLIRSLRKVNGHPAARRGWGTRRGGQHGK